MRHLEDSELKRISGSPCLGNARYRRCGQKTTVAFGGVATVLQGMAVAYVLMQAKARIMPSA